MIDENALYEHPVATSGEVIVDVAILHKSLQNHILVVAAGVKPIHDHPHVPSRLLRVHRHEEQSVLGKVQQLTAAAK